MAAFGPDFQRYLQPRLYRSASVTGLWRGLGILLAIGLAYFAFQAIAGLAISVLGFHAQLDDKTALLKSAIIGVFPASLAIAGFIWWVSKYRGGVPRDVLALRWARLGWLGWPLVVAGFLIVMYGVLLAVIGIFHIDLSQLQTGGGGDTETQDLVKQGMLEMAREPMVYWLAVVAVVVGAPIGEELVFRGYMFSMLAKTPVGLIGASLLTSASWAMFHKGTAPWFLVGVLFIMGLVLCCLLIRFGSLWVTLICHGVWNAITSLAIFGVAPQ